VDLPPPDSQEPDMNGLIGQWEHLAQLIAVEYDGMREEYANEIDCRTTLEENLWIIDFPGFESYLARLRQADDLFLAATTEDREWHRGVLKEYWNPQLHWWFGRRPLRPGPHWG